MLCDINIEGLIRKFSLFDFLSIIELSFNRYQLMNKFLVRLR